MKFLETIRLTAYEVEYIDQRQAKPRTIRRETVVLDGDRLAALERLGMRPAGYIAQQMSLSLKKFGCPNHLVNAGGDLVASGQAEGGHLWRVAIRSPHSASQMQGVVSLSNRALATSGVYEQRLRQGSGSHLVVPRTLNRPEIVSASVLAPDGMLADALATAFSVQAPRAVLDLCAGLKGVDCMLVLGNGSMVRSAGWPA